mgnify:CR=1 FL=1
MKVLITLPVKIGFDGMTKQVLSYARYMDKTDLEIDLLSCRGFDPNLREIVENSGFNHVYRIECRDTNQLRYFAELLKLMKERKYDVIHANGQSATLAVEMIAGVLSGCKLRIAHSHNSMCLHQKAHKLLNPIFKITCNDAIACSKEAGDWLFGKRKYWILKNGIDVEKFAFDHSCRKKYREKLAIKENQIALGNVAAFEPKKNQTFLIDIMNVLVRKNKNYILFLWGIDGSSKDAILKQIKELRLEDNVRYMGTTDKINECINAMDLMLLPSWYEGFPVTLVEWQANGLECLVSDTITSDCNISGKVEFLPINQGVDCWIEKICNAKMDLNERKSTENIICLRENGFDIKSNANELKQHYVLELNAKGR